MEEWTYTDEALTISGALDGPGNGLLICRDACEETGSVDMNGVLRVRRLWLRLRVAWALVTRGEADLVSVLAGSPTPPAEESK